jgi:uncharacterized protein
VRVVVSDTSPIRVLHHLNQLSLLARLFDEILVPSAVARECSRASHGGAEINVTDIPRCRVVDPSDTQAVAELEKELQTAEAEAIVLARELGAELLIDERAGPQVAERLRVPRVGVVGLLLRGKQHGLVPAVVPLILRARDELGFFLSDDLIEQARRLANE